MNMLLDEWNWDDAKEVWQEEAREEGLLLGMERGMEKGVEKGREEGREKGLLLGREKGAAEERMRLLNLMKQGYTAEMIEKMLQG
jgi:flagellar biosynthesis/type III secretory pathway protein FliH